MSNLSIRLKLICSIGLLALGYLLFLGLVEWTGADIRHRLHLASDSLFPAALASQQADAAFQKLNQDYKDAVLTQNQAMLGTADEDAKVVAAQLQIVRDKTAQNPAIQQQVASIQDQFKQISTQSKTAYAKMMSSTDAMDADLMGTIKNLATASTAMSKSLKELNETISTKEFSGELNRAAKATGLQLVLTISLFALALAFAVLIILGLQKQIAVPLKRAVDVLGDVAEGDLTSMLEVHSRDEVGKMAHALNEALGKIRTTLVEVSESAVNATDSSRQLAEASETIASGAQQQAASLEQTSASLEQITAIVRNTADHAQQASKLVVASKDSALQGQDVVLKAVSAMAEIHASSTKISDIISTIDEIAFQTNLLAVNAAVEAARAGEEGRGFAVVATEVRSLAQRSASAAKEIKGLIQDSVHKVETGSKLVNRSGETLKGIVDSVQRVTEIVQDIATASAEQSSGVDQVNTAMTQMDQITQSNSAQTEELSATAESLADQANHLQELVNKFVLLKHDDQQRGAKRSNQAKGLELSLGHPSSTNAKGFQKAGVKKNAPVPVHSRSQGAKSALVPSAGSAVSFDDHAFEEF